MFGIIALGDKQYKVVQGEACIFEKLSQCEGENIELSGLVLLNQDGKVILDAKELEKFKVKGTIIKQFREDKVIAYKKKRRQGYERKRGHRQYKTLVLINGIEA